MSPSKSRSAVSAPGQRGHNITQDCLLPMKSAHTGPCNYGRQGTRFQLHSPEHRCLSAPCKLPSTVVKISHVRKALKSPPIPAAVLRMPPEILGIIFENCLNQQASSRAVLSDAPLLLGRVCSYWRSITQGTPHLWTSLSLQFLETNVNRSRDGIKVAAAVETWLLRSYPAPLSIAFVDNRVFQKDTEHVVLWLLSRICMHAPRWKSIHLKFSSDYFIQLNILSSCAFTSLTSLSVHIDHMGWRRSLLSLRLDLTQAKRLTTLAFTGPDHVMREDVLVNWEHLTTVSFSYDLHEAGGESATLSRHFSKLALCKNLTELSIGLSTTLTQHLHHLDVIAHGQTMIPMIELQRLHTLRVRRLSRSAHACALLDALRLPRLSALHIDSAALTSWGNPYTSASYPDVHPPLLQMHAEPHWWHAHHFSALLDRSKCHLHTLHIQDFDMSPLELARLLTSPSTMPTLSTFTFEPHPRAYPISDVLSHLLPAPSPEPALNPSPSPSRSSSPDSSLPPTPGPRSPPFPSLSRLRLGCAHETQLESIADLIESRTGGRATGAGVCALSVFELVFYDFVYSHGQGRQSWRKTCFDAFKERVLRCAREGGVDVDIRVERPYEPAYISVPG